MQNKMTYIDFTESFQGVQTAIKLFENETHLFVYVNQHHNGIHLYNDFLRKCILRNTTRLKKKKIEIVCNLEKFECLDDIGLEISKIVNG